jgi:ionotropic kainate glutamate receptor 2
MYKTMMKNSEVLASTNEQGLSWVKKGGYAFFMESTSIEYITERDCEVARVGDLLDSKGYGIAMRKGVYHGSHIWLLLS